RPLRPRRGEEDFPGPRRAAKDHRRARPRRRAPHHQDQRPARLHGSWHRRPFRRKDPRGAGRAGAATTGGRRPDPRRTPGEKMTIDLRSDTVTKPSPPMREAMARAEGGDDRHGDEPPANRRQERVAEILGVEAALYVPSGSMANQIALKVNAEPGDDAIIGEGSHNWLYESGAGGALAGLQFTFAGKGGLFTAADVRALVK